MLLALFEQVRPKPRSSGGVSHEWHEETIYEQQESRACVFHSLKTLTNLICHVL